MEVKEGKDSLGERVVIDVDVLASFPCEDWLTFASELDAPEAPPADPTVNTIWVKSSPVSSARKAAKAERIIPTCRSTFPQL